MGFPYELAQGEKKARWVITYDAQDNVGNIQKFGPNQ